MKWVDILRNDQTVYAQWFDNFICTDQQMVYAQWFDNCMRYEHMTYINSIAYR